MGSTDWANVSYEVPSVETSYPIIDSRLHLAFAVVQAADSEMGYANTLTVARAMALTGIDLIVDQDLLASVKDEFTRAKAARGA